MPTARQLANLKLGAPPFNSESGRLAGKKGGVKSGIAKRTIKEIREWAEQNLFAERGEKKTPLFEMLFKKLEQLSSQGNLKAIEMLMNYSGLKPIDKVAQTTTSGEDVEKPLDIEKLKQLKEILK